MIQWYPGHMAKAKKEIKEVLKQVDIVYVILDARVPRSSINPDLLEIVSNKPVLYIYNKSSLADLKRLNEFLYEENIENYVIVDALERKNINQITKKTEEMLALYIKRQHAKGYKNVTIRSLVLGIPNVGKSTLINALAKKRVASTNKLPGHTKKLKWINIASQIYLLDTPGVLWPRFEDKKTGYNLGLTGAIKEDILPKDKLAKYGFSILNEKYPQMLKNFYEIETLEANLFFKSLAEKRGYLLENGEVNIDRAYIQFLNDLKYGSLGVICLD